MLRPIFAAFLAAVTVSGAALGQQMPAHGGMPSQEFMLHQRQFNHQADRTRHAQKTGDHKQTRSSPPFSIKPAPATNGDTDHTANAQSASNNKNVEWFFHFIYDINITDVVLAIFTGYLALYTRRLWSTTVELWKAGEKQIAVAAQAVEVARAAANATTAAAEVAHKGFISSHRPRIIIDRVAPAVNGVGESGLARLQVLYSIINVGQTDAHIVAHGYKLFRHHSSTLPVSQWFAMHPYNHILPSGSAMQATAAWFDEDNPDRPLHPKNLDETVFFMGCIRYRDDLGTERVTAFLRIYDPATERFIVSDDSYYEYAY